MRLNQISHRPSPFVGVGIFDREDDWGDGDLRITQGREGHEFLYRGSLSIRRIGLGRFQWSGNGERESMRPDKLYLTRWRDNLISADF